MPWRFTKDRAVTAVGDGILATVFFFPLTPVAIVHAFYESHEQKTNRLIEDERRKVDIEHDKAIKEQWRVEKVIAADKAARDAAEVELEAEIEAKRQDILYQRLLYCAALAQTLGMRLPPRDDPMYLPNLRWLVAYALSYGDQKWPAI